ncbi:DNA polymerase III subunit gamma/tau [Desulfovibrio sp. OttesenSCG-928-G15]|nr:DNA polymerase III subunit gamma/tau [Desulfovibrio sp. OttesenSCG-928-G15]
MSQVSLTAKYRPQTFAQVAGQDTVKAILSRASLEQRVAPAYLFSGTRGVGKTTLARIFAKALNCRNAPTAEPCNVCDQCRAVTAGSAVDVVEIDGASNRGIDDVRRLKEVVGYAAMEGGYKIFIIDEAHMLSREAFNALLKTLEEPPARVTFIMATTEPHKFPATIISRCQHYVFKPLSENGLSRHLSGVLEAESIEFDQAAVRLIARRGAGSVRDSMSLLGQVLALGEGSLNEESARSVLGLAGQESFLALLHAFQVSDPLAISRQLQQLLDQGLDIGFFLRELAGLWRNLFMLCQSGEAALSVIDLPENEARRYLEASRDFSLQQIHACWQMTLEGQRRVLTSLEPAQSLELLLLNLGMLPRLISLEKLSGAARSGLPSDKGNKGSQGGSQGGGQGSNTGGSRSEASGGGSNLPAMGTGGTSSTGELSSRVIGKKAQPDNGVSFAARCDTPVVKEESLASPAQQAPEQRKQPEKTEQPEQVGQATSHIARAEPAREDAIPPDGAPPFDPERYEGELAYVEASQPDVMAAIPDESASEPEFAPAHGPELLAEKGAGMEVPLQPEGENFHSETPGNDPVLEQLSAAPVEELTTAHAEQAVSYPEWDDLITYGKLTECAPWMLSLLKRLDGKWINGKLLIEAHDKFAQERFAEPSIREQMEGIFRGWCGHVPEYTVSAKEIVRKSRDELKAEVMEHPLVKEVQQHFGGYVIDFGSVQ